MRTCHRVLGDLHEAEDAAQEAFVTAYRSLASWRGDGPFGAWLTRIAIRIAVRQAGKRRSVTWLDPSRRAEGGVADPASAAATAAAMAATSIDRSIDDHAPAPNTRPNSGWPLLPCRSHIARS